MIEPVHLALLFGVAAAAGALNAVAGGGSFLTFPALVFAGVPPVSANATSSVALWPAGLGSAHAYRDDLATERRVIVPFAVASLIGGLLGALVLLTTPERAFAALVPWLLLASTLFFAVGSPIVERVRARVARRGPAVEPSLVWLTLTQFAIAVYGGYFGGGMGFLMLAAFTAMGMTNLHAMNGLKVVLGIAIKTVAVVAFAVAGVVAWVPAVVMIGGGLAGGWLGAAGALRVPQRAVRGFVTAIGFVLTAVFFARGGA